MRGQSEPKTGTVWRPLLEGVEAREALGAARQVAEILTRCPADTLPLGEVGDVALLCGYLYRLERNDEWAKASVRFLNSGMMRAIGVDRYSLGLHGGLSGFCWTVAHVAPMFGIDISAAVDGGSGVLDEADAVLAKRVASWDSRQTYDVISGYVGIGIYFLERLPDARARAGLERIVLLLTEQAVRSSEGISWVTRKEWLPQQLRASGGADNVNLGVAHGVPGCIYLLGELLSASIAADSVADVLDGALRWLTAQARPASAPSRFSSWVGPDFEERDSRVAWCYGDLGVGAVLEHVSRSRGDVAMASFGRQVVAAALGRPDLPRQWFDMGLCHGAFGVGHIANRLFQVTGDDSYRDHAVECYAYGLGLRRADSAIAGFYARQNDPSNPYVSDKRLLSGAVGDALALLAAASDVEPEWDRLLCLSGRPATC